MQISSQSYKNRTEIERPTLGKDENMQKIFVIPEANIREIEEFHYTFSDNKSITLSDNKFIK